MDSLKKFATEVGQRIRNRNGLGLAELFAVPLGPRPKGNGVTFTTQRQQLAEDAKSARPSIISACSSAIRDEHLSVPAGNIIECLVCLSNNDIPGAYKHQMSAFNAILDYFALKETDDQPDTTWIIPALKRVGDDLRRLADVTDEVKDDQDLTCRNECLQTMQKAFGVVGRDKIPLTSEQPRSKKTAVFAITNILFKGYFKGNTLNLCQKLIDYIHKISGAMNNLSLFSRSDVATYKYYLGRLRMFEDDYREAHNLLHDALRLTPRSAMKNRQRILVNLAPLEMCLGVMPTEVVSKRYGLVELYQLGQAVRKGDIRTFEQVMQAHQKRFIRLGIYLVLEKTKAIAYRNLFKRVYNLTKHQPNGTRLSLTSFECALKWLGESMDLDEIECIVSNLIFQSRIKGYLSHQKRTLVLSKADPFPSEAIVAKKAKI